jgi:hypothetical protein
VNKFTCTKQTAKKLADKGLDFDSCFVYYHCGFGTWNKPIPPSKVTKDEALINAPTLTEALKPLPESLAPHPEEVLQIRKGNGKWEIGYGTDATLFVDDRLVEAACQLLLHLDGEDIISLENLEL